MKKDPWYEDPQLAAKRHIESGNPFAKFFGFVMMVVIIGVILFSLFQIAGWLFL